MGRLLTLVLSFLVFHQIAQSAIAPSFSGRPKYESEMANRLEVIEDEISALKENGPVVGEDTGPREIKPTLRDLKSAHKNAADHFRKMKVSDSESWRDAKLQFELALNDLEDKMNQAKPKP